VPQEAIFRELEIALEHRGHLNAVYQMRAGRMPTKIDYLLRVHYGERRWMTPIVRTDRVKWGNDGLVSNRYRLNLMSDHPYDDPRAGLSQDELMRTSSALGFFGMNAFGMGPKPGSERLLRIVQGQFWSEQPALARLRRGRRKIPRFLHVRGRGVQDGRRQGHEEEGPLHLGHVCCGARSIEVRNSRACCGP
jgi:hypothetical protein